MNVETKKIKNNSEYQQELLKVSRDAGLSFVFTILGLVITYLTTLLITRVLGAEDFGIFTLAQTILLATVPIAALGLNHGVLRFTSLYDGLGEPGKIKGLLRFALRRVLFSSVLITVLVFIAAPQLKNMFGLKNDFGSAIRVLIFGLPFAVLAEIVLAGLQGLRYAGEQTFVRNIIQQGIRLVMVALFFSIGLRLQGVLWATVIGFFAALIIAIYIFNVKFMRHHKEPASAVQKKEIVHFAIPMFIDNLLQRGAVDLPVLLLGYFLTATEVGVYAVAFRLTLLVSLPLSAVNLIFAPTISNLHGRGEKDILARLFKTLTKWVFTAGLCVGLGLILFARPVLSLFGKDFTSGAQVLILLVCAQLVNAGVGSVGYMLTMTGRPRLNLANSAGQFLITLVAGVLFIPWFGVLGAGATVALGLALVNVARLIQVFVLERFHPYNAAFLKPAFSACLAVGVVTGLRMMAFFDGLVGTALLAGFFLLTFLLCLLALRFSDDDYLVLNAIRRKLKWA